MNTSLIDLLQNAIYLFEDICVHIPEIDTLDEQRNQIDEFIDRAKGVIIADCMSKNDICKVTGENHQPDWNSIVVDFEGEAYIDIRCINCGTSGCIGRECTGETGLKDLILW